MRRGGRRRELDPEQIVAVDGKRRLRRHPAARAPWQLVDARVLPLLGAEAIAVHHHRRGGIADGEPADLLRGVEIPLHDRRRHEEEVGDVVEAARRVVGRQEQRVVDLLRERVDREQIADGVLIFRAAETMDERELAGMRRGERVAIDGRLEICRERVVGRAVRPRRVRRRHGARSKLPNDLLPGLGVRRRMFDVDAGQREPAGLQPVVVAGDAVLIDGRLNVRSVHL